MVQISRANQGTSTARLYVQYFDQLSERWLAIRRNGEPLWFEGRLARDLANSECGDFSLGHEVDTRIKVVDKGR